MVLVHVFTQKKVGPLSAIEERFYSRQIEHKVVLQDFLIALAQLQLNYSENPKMNDRIPSIFFFDPWRSKI